MRRGDRLHRLGRDAAEGYFIFKIYNAIGEKHGCPTDAGNLAYACLPCDRQKGSDFGSIAASGRLLRFFNPRADRWADHVRLDESAILPLTEIGEVTERTFRLNAEDRLVERRELRRVGRYPAPGAKGRAATPPS